MSCPPREAARPGGDEREGEDRERERRGVEDVDPAAVPLPAQQLLGREAERHEHELEVEPVVPEPEEQVDAEDDRHRAEADPVGVAPGPAEEQVEPVGEGELAGDERDGVVDRRPVPAPVEEHGGLRAGLQVVLGAGGQSRASACGFGRAGAATRRRAEGSTRRARPPRRGRSRGASRSGGRAAGRASAARPSAGMRATPKPPAGVSVTAGSGDDAFPAPAGAAGTVSLDIAARWAARAATREASAGARGHHGRTAANEATFPAARAGARRAPRCRTSRGTASCRR